jgi:hypothetical protein
MELLTGRLAAQERSLEEPLKAGKAAQLKRKKVKRQGGELWQRLAGKKDTITVRARTTEKAFKVNANKLNKILKDNFFSSHLLYK